MPVSHRCVYCDPVGSGKCRACLGSGADIHLNSSEKYCSACNGTGLCNYCEGTGYPVRTDFRFADILPDWLANLFGKSAKKAQ